MAILEAKELSISYDGKNVVENLSLEIERGKITVILGPNGSGKSSLLKALAKNLKPAGGLVYLDGVDISALSSNRLACLMAVMYQSPRAPGDVTVRELVEYGRFPHQKWWRSCTEDDSRQVEWAIEQTGLRHMADRQVATLSGGEQQRVWIAMALAQNPQVLLLDEPTTYLDICHQLEIMELVASLNRRQGITVVMVLHDINHAAKYADYIAVLNRGRLVGAGSPAKIITAGLLREVFKVEADVWTDKDGRPVSIVRGLAQEVE